MTAHDALDGVASLVGVVERDGADIVMENVGFNDSVQKLATNKTKFPIDGRCGASCVGPGLGGVVGQGRVGVLKEGNGD